MANVINIIGKKFGKLLVLTQLEERGKSGQIYYECKCDCGNIHKTSGHSIRSGRSKSCGCSKKEYIPKTYNLDREEQILIQLYKSTVEKRAKNKNWNNIIDFDFFKILSYSNCFYCGTKPIMKVCDRKKNKEKTKISETKIMVNGIDRKDSSIGYTKHNSVSCCKHCNTAKNDMNIEDFKNWIKKIYEYNFK